MVVLKRTQRLHHKLLIRKRPQQLSFASDVGDLIEISERLFPHDFDATGKFVLVGCFAEKDGGGHSDAELFVKGEVLTF